MEQFRQKYLPTHSNKVQHTRKLFAETIQICYVCKFIRSGSLNTRNLRFFWNVLPSRDRKYKSQSGWFKASPSSFPLAERQSNRAPSRQHLLTFQQPCAALPSHWRTTYKYLLTQLMHRLFRISFASWPGTARPSYSSKLKCRKGKVLKRVEIMTWIDQELGAKGEALKLVLRSFLDLGRPEEREVIPLGTDWQFAWSPASVVVIGDGDGLWQRLRRSSKSSNYAVQPPA